MNPQEVLGIWDASQYITNDTALAELRSGESIVNFDKSTITVPLVNGMRLVNGATFVALDIPNDVDDALDRASQLASKFSNTGLQALATHVRIRIDSPTLFATRRSDVDVLVKFVVNALKDVSGTELPYWVQLAANRIVKKYPFFTEVSSNASIYKRLCLPAITGDIFLEIRADEQTVDFALQKNRAVFETLESWDEVGRYTGLYDYLPNRVRVRAKYKNNHPTVILPIRGESYFGQEVSDADKADAVVKSLDTFFNAHNKQVLVYLNSMT